MSLSPKDQDKLNALREKENAIRLAGIIYWIWKGRPKASKDTWDKVTIETRGGKQVPYCVDLGQGKIDMDVIEEARKK